MARITHVYRKNNPAWPWLMLMDDGIDVVRKFATVAADLAAQGDTLPDWDVAPGTMQTPIPLPKPVTVYVLLHGDGSANTSRHPIDDVLGSALWVGSLTVTPDGELIATKAVQ